MRKWVVGLVATIAVISVGGIGFAAFTSSVTLQLNGSVGSTSIVWTGPATPTVTAVEAIPSDTAQCSAVLTPSSIVVKFINIAPNDQCMIPQSDGIYVQNTGTLTAALGYTNQASWPGHDSCGFSLSSENLFPPASPLAPGAMTPTGGFTGVYSLVGGNGCEGSTITWWLNVTATAGT